MGEAELDSLLARMPKIAAAVNEFKSEAIQQSVFNALLAAYGFKVAQATLASAAQEPDPLQGREAEPATKVADEGAKQKVSAPAKQKRSNGGGTTTGFKFDRDLNLRPEGKQSFAEFAAQKSPASNEDKVAVAVYYLEHVLEVPTVTSDLVATVFRIAEGWRESKNIRSLLRNTSGRKGTITTTDLDDIHTTAHGRNFVEHDLPIAAKAKA
ncbi:hypothetical protein [Mesorhizobium sp.]|uniref:hypothetical protein n=1 Tax=Mesorhizobium sp. TaxID=1871066 RepID=UPI000FE66F38|nr:hypothetical protein [Mesorhizobium sp.]RWA71907.1 MAG: hypothetical protein EOQ29_10135 [Mesorhizobium sp.]RWA84035.1 MAG: hypothetical protein EOQ30_11940 [Mesorhizobium sp.]